MFITHDVDEAVFLANRVDGNLITPDDIGEVIRVVEGRGL